jgi:hypothetical protein
VEEEAAQKLGSSISQLAHLKQLPRAAVLLDRHVLDYAKTHPNDPEQCSAKWDLLTRKMPSNLND